MASPACVGVARRRQPERQASSGERTQHVAAARSIRDAFDGDQLERRLPRLGPELRDRIAVGDRVRTGGERELAGDVRRRAPLRSRRARCARSSGSSTCSSGMRSSPVVSVLDAVEQPTQHAERRRHDAAGRTGMHAFAQHSHGDVDRRRARAATWSATAGRSRRSPNRGTRRGRAGRCGRRGLRCTPRDRCWPTPRSLRSSTMQRACRPPVACTASIALIAANAA